MFQQNLIKSYDKIVLKYKDQLFTGGFLLKRAETFGYIFGLLQLRNNDMVAINSENPAMVVSAIIACMSYGVNFTILDPKEPATERLAKLYLANQSSYNWLVLSKEIIDTLVLNLLTIDPEKLEVISKGIEYNNLSQESKDKYDAFFKQFEDYPIRERHRVKRHIKLPTSYLRSSEYYCVVFHKGINREAYDSSRISHSALKNGMSDSIEIEGLMPKNSRSVLYLEEINLLYNVINGILVPILTGHVVTVVTSTDFYFIARFVKYRKLEVIYSSTEAIEYILKVIEKNAPPSLKRMPFKLFFSFYVRRQFKQIFGKDVKHLILKGKPLRRDLLNYLHIKITSIYAMAEVATYIAKGTFRRLPKEIGLTPRKSALVRVSKVFEKSKSGEIILRTNDMLECYLTPEDTLHELFGKGGEYELSTRDIGYEANGKLFINNTANEIFTRSNGVTVNSDRINKLVREYKIVKDCYIFSHKGKVMLVIEPDFVYIDSNKISPSSLYDKVENMKKYINFRCDNYSKIDEIIIYGDSNGLPRKRYKIISRYFGQ